MRIVLAHNRYRSTGGEERHFVLLKRQLEDLGHEVFAYERSSATLRRARIAMAAASMTYSPSAGRHLTDFLRNCSPEIVHFHNITPLLTPAALRAAKRSGARVVLTAHNYRLVCPGGTMLRRGRLHDDCIKSSLLCGLRGARSSRAESIAYGLSIEIQRRLRLVGRWTDAIVTPSQFLADVLVRGGYEAAKVHVIPNGVETRTYLREDGGYAFYAGRLADEKGIRTLLRAAKLSRVPLTVAGDGPLYDFVQAHAGNGIRFLGQLAPEEVTDVRRGAGLAVVPSECPEVLPFTAIEALAEGVPVVATSVGGLAEVVEDGETGFLVPPRDPAALARAMRQLADDPERRQAMGRAARRAAQERFDLLKQTERLAELYRSLL